MIVIVTIHRCCSWKGLFNSFLPSTACVVSAGAMEAVLQKSRLSALSQLESSEPYVLRVLSLQQSGPILNLWLAHKCYINNIYCLENYLTNHWKGGFTCLLLGVCSSMDLVSSRWDRTWNICLSRSGLPHILCSFLGPSTYL